MIISLDKYKATGGGGEKPTEVLTQTITANGSQTFNPQEGYVFSSAEITTDVHPTEALVATINENGSRHFDGEYNGADITTNIHPTEALVATINENGSRHFDGEYNGADITVDVETSTTTNFETGLISTAELIEEARAIDDYTKRKYKNVQVGNYAYKILKYSDLVLPKLNGWNNTGGFPELTYNSETSSVEYVKDQNGNDAQFLFPSTYVINYLPKIIDGTYLWDGIKNGLVLKTDMLTSFNSEYTGSFGLLDDSNNEQSLNISEIGSVMYLKDKDSSILYYNDLKGTSGEIQGFQTVIPSEYGYGKGIHTSNKWVYTGVDDIQLLSQNAKVNIVKDEFINLNNVKFKPIIVDRNYAPTNGYCNYSLPIDIELDFNRTGDYYVRMHFDNCTTIKSITVNDITNDTFDSAIEWGFRNCEKLKSINFISNKQIGYGTKNLSNTFYNCSSLTSIPPLDTSNATRMDDMFAYCSSLTSIPALDTSNVTSMNSMFVGCSSLTSIPALDTSNVTIMDSMFKDCSSLTSIPVLDTSNATNVQSLFYGCSSLISIPLLDATNVRYANLIFERCDALTDLGGFKNLSISITYYFLDKCPNLTVESLMNVINNLATVSGKTLKFGSTNLNKLTAEQIAVATAKGWTLTK